MQEAIRTWKAMWKCPLGTTINSYSRLELQTDMRGHVRYVEITESLLNQTEIDLLRLQPDESVMRGEYSALTEDIPDSEYQRREEILNPYIGWLMMRGFMFRQFLNQVVGAEGSI